MRLGDSEVYNAWVRTDPLEFLIYVDDAYAAIALPEQLCRSAHHEVCHQRLSIMGLNDDDDHVAVYRCMKQIGVKDCEEE